MVETNYWRKEERRAGEKERRGREGRLNAGVLNMARAALIREGEFRRMRSAGTQKRRTLGRPAPIQEVKNALKKLPPI